MLAVFSRCILSKFYIKPQRLDSSVSRRACCILSKFYIKPQLFSYAWPGSSVVSYRNSTSNHNTPTLFYPTGMLYLIEILHQTTTTEVGSELLLRCILSKFYIKPQLYSYWVQQRSCCILSKFYIKPQLSCGRHDFSRRCILSKFYIKPQHSQCHFVILGVVSYRNSTSNHNDESKLDEEEKVVSYRNSTSNHNYPWRSC